MLKLVKQNQLLNFLIVRIEKYGVSPSYEEICEELQLKSKSGIHRIVKSLEERGYIKRLENKDLSLMHSMRLKSARTQSSVLRAMNG